MIQGQEPVSLSATALSAVFSVSVLGLMKAKVAHHRAGKERRAGGQVARSRGSRPHPACALHIFLAPVLSGPVRSAVG